MTKEEIEFVIWMQDDARYCYGWAQTYSADPSKEWLAPKVQEAAAASAAQARRYMTGADE